MFKSKYFTLTVLGSIILGLVPTIIFFLKLGHYPQIPIEITDDKLYYLSRVREVLSGNIFIGNSYLLEHAKDTSMAFFVADWFYAIPFYILKLIGVSLSIPIVMSEVLWTTISGLLIYILFEKFGLEKKDNFVAVVLTISSILFFVLRPVSMAVVYPVYLLFLISYLGWIRNPTGKRENISLVISSTLSFYVYTYLWQVAFVVLVLTGVLFFLRNGPKRNVLNVICSSIFLSLPVFFYTYKQVSNPHYLETIYRVGLTNTHLFGLSTIVYSLLIVVAILLCFVLRFKEKINELAFNFFTINFLSIFIVSLSNVITGKDLELATHVGRFADLLLPVFLFYVLFLCLKKMLWKSVSFIFFVILLLYFIANTKQTFVYSFSNLNTDDQVYSGVIQKISTFDPNEVVFSDDTLSYYVPVLTHNYVLFNPNAQLNIVSDFEIQERYLLSRSLVNLNKDEIRQDLRKYAGVGRAIHQANSINRAIKVCRIFSSDCGEYVTSYSILGDQYFNDLYDRYGYIKKNQAYFFGLYKVKYIVVDVLKDKWSIPASYKKIWSDGRFDIFVLN